MRVRPILNEGRSELLGEGSQGENSLTIALLAVGRGRQRITFLDLTRRCRQPALGRAAVLRRERASKSGAL